LAGSLLGKHFQDWLLPPSVLDLVPTAQ
jgi:hypothetical protein